MVDPQTYRDLTHGIYPPRKGATVEIPEPYIATLQDEPIFRRLAMKLMEHEYELGGLVIPNEYNLEIQTKLFRAYAAGDFLGYTLLIGTFAMVMHGEVPGGFQMKPGKCAYLHAIYIEPEYRGKGVTHKFHKFGMARLPGMGFDFTMFQTLANNEQPIQAMHGTVEGKENCGNGQILSVVRWWPFEKGQTE